MIKHALVREIPIALVIGALTAGCNSKSSIVNGKGSEADRIANVWWLMFGLAVFVYVVVAAFILYASTRGHRKGQTTSRLRDNAFIWIGGVVGPVVILAVLAVVTVTTTSDLRRPSGNELRIDVVGKLWWWAVTYPGEGVTTANEMYLPAGRPVEIVLTSDNVIHSFWVPELAGKQDLIPGQTNRLRFTPEVVGTYLARCAEFCGVQHTHMGLRVYVVSTVEYGRWLARRQIASREPASETAEAGQVAFQREACAGCHTIAGTTATGVVGPDLTDIGARQALGAGVLLNNPQNLERWIRNAPSVKPGVLMPPFLTLSDREVSDMVAYLESLK